MGEGKIAFAIVAAAALLAVVFIGYREFDRARSVREATEAVNQIMRIPAEAAAEFRRQQQRARRVDLLRRELRGDQRCVDGVVIVASGSSYSQLGTVGDPVRCSGGYADRAIR